MPLSIRYLALTLAVLSGIADSATAAEFPAQPTRIAFSRRPQAPLHSPFPGLRGREDSQGTDGLTWSPAREAKALVAQMTLAEKVNLTTGIYDTRCTGESGSVARLNIPQLCFADGTSGVRSRVNVSQFPAQISVAATWDVDLIAARAAAMSQEFHDVGANFMFGPVAASPSGRSPLSGRYWEGNGGDEYLSGRATYAATKAAQEQGTIVTLKHFFGNEQDTARGIKTTFPALQQPYSVNIDDTTVHQTYMWPFAEGVRAGGGLVMCAYNRINGVHACSNNATLNGLLKTELNFQGAVISDYGAVWSLDDSVKGGMDLLMPGDGGHYFGIPVLPNEFGTNGKKLQQAVKEGRIPESRVDDMVSRILAAALHYQDGLRNRPPVTLDAGNGLGAPESKGNHPSVQRDHYKVIRQIGTESLTLLKNSNVSETGLPIDAKKINTIAIIGGDAGPHEDKLAVCTALGGCVGAPKRTVTIGEGSGYAVPPYVSDPLGAIQAYLSQHHPTTKVLSSLDTTFHSKAVKIATQADVAVVFIGQVRAEGTDQSSYGLDKFDNEQVKKVAAVNKNTVVVIHAGGPASVEEWIEHPNVTAVLWAYYPGQESGNALVPVLFGDESPSGRLPFTIGKRIEDYEPNNLYKPSALETNPQLNFTERDLIDWKWFDAKGVQPRFWFGEGLSYTEFKYGQPSLSNTLERDNTSIQRTNEQFIDETQSSSSSTGIYDITHTVSVAVTNTGSRAAKHVVQLYVALPGTQDGDAQHLLRGFAKLSLQPGETRSVQFALHNKDLSRWDAARKAWVKRKGSYTFFVSPKGAGRWTSQDGTAVLEAEL